MFVNIPKTEKKRVVIIGGGFAGLTLARKLNRKYFQVVLLDKNNYNQFQPLLYQVATAGLEPSAISFPFRKVFQKKAGMHFRMCEALRVVPERNTVETNVGDVSYDYLVVANGSTTNYFGMEHIQTEAMPMKSVSEALGLRNSMLRLFEAAISTNNPAMLNIVVVGGGPTGVEVSGALAEMKEYILPKDYPDISFSDMQIYLVEAHPRLLAGMSEKSSGKALHFLKDMGVQVILGISVKDYIDGKIVLSNGKTIDTQTVIWASGIIANVLGGISTPEHTGRGARLKVDQYNHIEGFERIFAIGDVCLQTEKNFPNGHPQMAQVAIQQARNLARNLLLQEKGEGMSLFHYSDKGSMATIGRNKAVVDLPFIHFHGFFAWMLWMFVHLMSILGMKNKAVILIDWSWSYLTYDPSLRLIIAPDDKKTHHR